LLKLSRTLAVLGAAAFVAGACQEKLTGGNACPSLCPEQNLGFKDTIFAAADVIDTFVTVPGTPPLGTLNSVLIAAYTQGGDSVVSGAVFRFDSITRVEIFADTSMAPVPITHVDTAFLQVYYNLPPTTGGQDTLYVRDSSLTFHVWDVYVNAPDLDTAAVHAKFYGTEVGRLTTTRDTIQAANNQAIKIPIDTAFMNTAVHTGRKVWLGVTVESANGARIVVTSANASILGTFAAQAPALKYYATADTFKTLSGIAPNARATPYGPAIPAMGNYQMIFRGSNPIPPGLVAVGGLAQSRLLVRFKFPSWLIDSSTTVVKANLELTQVSNPQFLWDSASMDADSIGVHPYALVAAPGVTDILTQGMLVGDVTLAPIPNDSLRPEASGVDTLRMVSVASNIFQYWKLQGSKVQRGLVYSLPMEGIEPRSVYYYGVTAAPALRPRVHVSYVPHSIIGLP
jgi:hypothetical protein